MWKIEKIVYLVSMCLFTGFKFQWRTPLRSLEGVFSRMENESDQGKTVEDSLTNHDLLTESGAESIPDSKVYDAVTSGILFKHR